MPVYPQTYRHYDGIYRPRALAWTVIASSGILRKWRSPGTYWILFIGFCIFFGYASRLYLAANADLVEWFGMNPSLIERTLTVNDRFYMDYLQSQLFTCFLLTLVVGADLISADRRTKALVLYLSKPITLFDYIFGKAGVLLAFLLGILWLGGWTLMLLNALFTEDWGYLVRNAALAARVAAYSILLAAPYTVIILGLSSLVRSKMAGIALFCVVLWLPDILINVFLNLAWRLRQFGGESEWWSLFSLYKIWEQLGAALFQQETPYNVPWALHLAALGGILFLFGLIMVRQIRAVEVVR